MKEYLFIFLFFIITVFPKAQSNLDFENGLSGWTKTGSAFDNQPTYGNNVKAIRVRPEIADSIGGDYWIDTHHPIGHHGDYWIGTYENHPLKTEFGKEIENDIQGDSQIGTLVSDEFVIKSELLYFLIGGTGGKVELLIKTENAKNDPNGILINGKYYISKLSESPTGFEVMTRTNFYLKDFISKKARIRIVDDRTDAHINVDDFVFIDKATLNSYKLKKYGFTTSYKMGLESKDSIQFFENRDTANLPMWGFADTHAHWMNDVGFSGNLVHGSPYGNIEIALKHCGEHHSEEVLGFIGNTLLQGFDPDPRSGYFSHEISGYPEFVSWPNFRTTTHQLMYVDWVRRAFYGGLRLLVCQLSNNESLANFMGNVSDFTDLKAVEIEHKQLVEMVKENSEWMEIAKSPSDLKRINLSNKLAIIVGMEIDKPYNWSTEENCKDEDLVKYVNYIYDKLDVRYYFPVHIADNAFGGFSLYGSEQFCISNAYIRRNLPDSLKYVNIQRNSLVSFGLGRQPKDFPFLALANICRYEPPGAEFVIPLEEFDIIKWVYPYLHAKGLIFNGKSDYTNTQLGHINSHPLTNRGKDLISILMRKGMIIDIDHMDFKTNDSTLSLLIRHRYPVIAGHTNFLEQELNELETGGSAHCRMKLKNEHGKSLETLGKIRLLGGMVSPVTEGDKDVNTFSGSFHIENDNPGSSKTWAQTYLYALDKMNNKSIAFGSDFNGFLTEIAPRFSTFSAYSSRDDEVRQETIGNRKNLALSQNNGVLYETPLQDCRLHKFYGEGVFDENEQIIWQSLFIAHSGNKPEDEKSEFLYKDKFDSSLVRGLIWGIGKLEPEDLNEQRYNLDEKKIAAYIVSHNFETGNELDWHNVQLFWNFDTQEISSWIPFIERIYSSWMKMKGKNKALKRFTIPTSQGPRDFDFNIDGLANYGLFPDFLQDLHNIGLNGELLSPLMNSAGDYLTMWQKCTLKSIKIKKMKNK